MIHVNCKQHAAGFEYSPNLTEHRIEVSVRTKVEQAVGIHDRQTLVRVG